MGCELKPVDLDKFVSSRIDFKKMKWEAHLASSDTETQLALLDHVRRKVQGGDALDMGYRPLSSCIYFPLPPSVK